MGTLLIDVTDDAAWLLRDGVAVPWRTGQTPPPDTRVVALAPAEAVAWHRVDLPARRLAEQRQAAPYALEDRLAQPVEQLHFALGVRDGGQIEVGVVAKETLRQWLARLESLSLSADRLVADAHLLPRTANGIHMAHVGERVLAATDSAVMAMPAADWPAWRRLLPASSVHRLGSNGRFDEGEGATAQALDRTGFLRYAVSRLDTAPDLLQGEFAPRQRDAGQKRLWRWAAILAGLAVALSLVDAAVGVLVERHRRDALRTQMAEVFREAMPDARMTGDPGAQLAAELGRPHRGGRAGGMLALLSQVAPTLTQGSRYRLESLDYRLGTLELEVAADDVASLDALRETLAANGLPVEVTGIDSGEGGVRGRLRLRGATS